MEKQIPWEEKMDHAIARAGNEKKPILLDFFNPG